MRALTLYQPWASLIALGHKQFETRSWRPGNGRMGEAIAIHAGMTEDREFRKAPMVQEFLGPSPLPKGAVVAAVLLDSVHPTGNGGLPEAIPKPELPHERRFGNYAPGRWAWKLTGLYRLPGPVPHRGAMGLWKLPDDLGRRLLAEWQAHYASQ